MATTANKPAESKPKRKTLTAAERIAKLEADLKAAREKAHDKDRKVVERATAELKKLTAKRNELDTKIKDIESEIKDAQSRIDGPVTDGVGEADSNS